METRFLETLAAVAQRGSFAGAAVQLGITANAVSQRLKALEDEFGMPLVTRAGRTVTPTEAGHAILARLPGFLRELRNLREAPLSQAIEGELKLGAISTALTGVLPPALETLAQDHPGLRLFLEPGTSSNLFDRVSAGLLDAALIVRPSFDWPKALVFRLLRQEPLIMLIPDAETRSDPTAILVDWPLILYDRAQWGGRQARAWLEARGQMPAARFELDALDAIAVLVDRNLGVAVVPDWAGPYPAGLTVRKLPLHGAPTRDIGLFAPRNSDRLHLLRVLHDALKAGVQ